MEIDNSSSALSSAQAQNAIGISLLRKGMDIEKQQVTQLLEGIPQVDTDRPRGEQVRLEA